MVGGTLLAAAVLQVEGQQAGEAGAAAARRQQGGDRTFKNGGGAASGDRDRVRLERADRLRTGPGVHGHLGAELRSESKDRHRGFR